MIGRYHCSTNKRYADYGGRGIRVCDRWRRSLAAFIDDMGRRPSSAHQIDRKNNDGNYEPANCRWATRVQQGRNKRNNVVLTHEGRSQPLSAWAVEIGMKYQTLVRRVRIYGWPTARALTEAVR
jgi:hypothetical protein